MTYPDDNPKTAHGALKVGMQTIPHLPLVELGMRMQGGANKYGPFNWRDKTISTSVYIGAIMRHLASFMDGEWADPECPYRTSHVSAIMACCLLLSDSYYAGRLNDDRPTSAPSGKLIKYLAANGCMPTPKELQEWTTSQS